jgi:hypothetical protein
VSSFVEREGYAVTVRPPSVVTTVAAVRRDAGDEAQDADATLDLPRSRHGAG